MKAIKKRVLVKKNNVIKLYEGILATNSYGSENCCNGSFACCGAPSCG